VGSARCRAPTTRSRSASNSFAPTLASLALVCWPYFTVGLATRGHSDEDIAKILSGNFLRVMEAVQDAATTG